MEVLVTTRGRRPGGCCPVRRRLLLVLSVFALVAVAGPALLLLDRTSAGRTERFTQVRAADLDRFAALAGEAIGPHGSATGRDVLAHEIRTHVGLYGEGVIVVGSGGGPIITDGLAADDPGVAAAVDAALRDQPAVGPDRIGPLTTDTVLLSRPVGIGTEVDGAVVLRADPSAAAADVAQAWAFVGAGALAAAIALVVAAFLVARWVLHPMDEQRALAGELDRMADALATGAAQQRRLVADLSDRLDDPPALDGLLRLAAADSLAAELAAGRGEPARADVAEVVRDQAERWTAAARQARVRVEIEPGPPAEVACAADELGQVLGVLLDNAITYAGAGAMVEVGWQRADTGVRLHVRDDGPGLPPSRLAMATRRFWRAPDVGDRAGSGLGLAVAERLVGIRGGTLRVAAAPFRGLIVTVELPCP